jgi:signal transduction histidine kinase
MSEAKVLTVPHLNEIHMPSLDQLLKLLDVCRYMGLEKNLENLLIYIAEQGRKALKADRCSIFLLDEERNEIWSKVQLGESQIIRFPRGAGVAGKTIETGKTILIHDAYNTPLFNADIDKATGYRTRNILCVPMANLDGKSIGCLQLLNKLDGDFLPSDETFSIAFASQAAVAIESAYLYQEKSRIIRDLSNTQVRLKQKLDQLEVVRELERNVNDTATLYDFISMVIRRAVSAVGAEVGCLMIKTGDQSWEAYAARFEERSKVIHFTRSDINSRYLKDLLEDGRAVIINNLGINDVYIEQLSQQIETQLENLLAIPIHQNLESDHENQAQGIFEVFNKPSGFVYEDLSFMQIIGAQIFSLIVRRQLIDEKERAKSLAAIGQVASTIIHDLKNPISAIIGCAELLGSRDQMAEQQVERVCTIIRNQANRCITMVEELLSVARGEKKFRFEVIPLNEVLSEIEFMLQAETERHKVVLETSFDYDGLVRVDRAKLMRVIFNLTNNALEILKAGGKITIETRAIDTTWVELLITDTGPGIPPELGKALFQPFATYGKSKGTGLGLYIAREIIRDHGGTIELDTSHTGGARFRIKLKQEV